MSLFAAALAALLAAKPPTPPPVAAKASWAGDEMPLQLSVRTPEDLAFKSLAERHFLIFNLISEGKVAWDAGDWATAASKWESLLRLPNLPADVTAGVQPFALEARKRAGGAAASPVAMATTTTTETSSAAESTNEPRVVAVRGTVTGGGGMGPGGTVVWLERKDGATPRPKPAKGKVVVQKDKAFNPRVIAVPVGTSIAFRNDDDLFHDVFSLSKPSDFDLGLYKGGASREQRFDTPGPVQLLCNIHASMQGWVFVVKSPWYAQADSGGSFTIRGVPPGEYVLHAWHEAAARPTERPIRVGDSGAVATVAVGADAAKQTFVPDKYGKPRQVQLGY